MFDLAGCCWGCGATATATAPLPNAGEPHDFDVQAEADAARGPVPPLDKSYVGQATVETYTVFYARDGKARAGVVVARTPAGNRTLARVPGTDVETIAWLTDGAAEPVGSVGEIVADGDDMVWRRASA